MKSSLSKCKALLSVAVLVALTGLSFFSGYGVESVGDMNFEIATMLTPVGLLRNLVLENSHYLRPYYFQPIQGRPSLLDSWAIAGFGLGLCVVSFGLLMVLRHECAASESRKPKEL